MVKVTFIKVYSCGKNKTKKKKTKKQKTKNKQLINDGPYLMSTLVKVDDSIEYIATANTGHSEKVLCYHAECPPSFPISKRLLGVPAY